MGAITTKDGARIHYDGCGSGQPLVLHGDGDPIVPIHPGGAHGMCTTQKDEVDADLLAFLRG